jgi:hypothetical protein
MQQPAKGGVGIATRCEHDDYLGGFGIIHGDTGSTFVREARIVKWDSLA